MDWLIADALTLFQRRGILADGAAALYLSSEPGPAVSVELDCVSDPQLFTRAAGRSQAARSVRNAVRSEDERGGLLCDSLQGAGRIDDAEMSAWADWPGARISPKRLLGEGLTAAAGWQCIAAADALVNGAFPTATVNIVGCNQQAIAARFVRNSERKSVV